MFGCKHLGHFAAAFADPSPGARHSNLAKQRWLNEQQIVARHVPGRIDALAIEPVGVKSHADRFGASTVAVQQDF